MIIKGVAVPFGYSSVDTDAMFPVSGEPTAASHGWGAALFHRWRADPAFILNSSVYEGATILVADADFGIGSSRETAVWALAGAGFRAVLAPSFGDIFRSNCVRNGVLTAVIDPDARRRVHDYLVANPGAELEVDVAGGTVAGGTVAGGTAVGAPRVCHALRIDGFAQRMFLEGIDEFSLLLGLADTTDAALRPAPDTRSVA
jgi:3-isopropylmalate/(R)-2-methylmalate dehydratase small subunit